MNEVERKAAEHDYSIKAFDYASNPTGSRDWTLFLMGWQAALEWQRSQVGEPFGYFKCEFDGWVDCAETDEGAIALYEAPPTAQINQQLLHAQTMGQINTPDFLEWLADRLVHVYKEPENVDFVLSLRGRAKAGKAALTAAKS